MWMSGSLPDSIMNGPEPDDLDGSRRAGRGRAGRARVVARCRRHELHDAEQRRAEQQRQLRIGGTRGDHEGVVVGHRDAREVLRLTRGEGAVATDHVETGTGQRLAGLGGDPLERGGHIRRGHRRAVGERGVVAEGEGPRRAGRVGRPAGRQRRHRLLGGRIDRGQRVRGEVDQHHGVLIGGTDGGGVDGRAGDGADRRGHDRQPERAAVALVARTLGPRSCRSSRPPPRAAAR